LVEVGKEPVEVAVPVELELAVPEEVVAVPVVEELTDEQTPYSG
jgi:hypothetical protein